MEGLEGGELLRLVMRHWIYATCRPVPVAANSQVVVIEMGRVVFSKGIVGMPLKHGQGRFFRGGWRWLQPPGG